MRQILEYGRSSECRRRGPPSRSSSSSSTTRRGRAGSPPRTSPRTISRKASRDRSGDRLPGAVQPLDRWRCARRGHSRRRRGRELAEGEEAEEEEEEGFDPESIPEDEVEYYEIEFAKEGETIEVANNETILDAGEDEGWDLPYACREGQCVSCAGQVQDGNAGDYIQHINNEALFDDDMEEGYCLTCVACPTDEFTIETGEQPWDGDSTRFSRFERFFLPSFRHRRRRSHCTVSLVAPPHARDGPP